MIGFQTAGRTRSGETQPGRTVLGGIGGVQVRVRAMVVILTALASIAMAGCATGGAGEVGYVAPTTVSAPSPTAQSDAAPAAAKPSVSKVGAVVGLWEGVTQASCALAPPGRCNAQEKITLTLIEGDKGLTGFYRCAYGTMNCYNMNETGKIVRATLNGGQMTARVAMPDGTSCIYTGRATGNKIIGGYSCYGGGALIESGSWKGRRSY